MMEKQANRVLEPFYYLDNFLYLINFVEERSGNILSQDEKQYIDRFRKLTKQEQALYVRMFNRRGLFFNIDKFKYNEIISIKNTAKKLIKKGFASKITVAVVDDLKDLLNIFTKEELRNIYLNHAGIKLNQSLHREKILAKLSEYSVEELIKTINRTYNIIKQTEVSSAEMIKFLFFGSVDIDMSEFVIRDIGNAVFEDFDEKKLSAFFTCRKEAEDKWRISLLYKNYKIKREQEPVYNLYEWFNSQVIEDLSDSSESIYSKFINKLASDLERSSFVEEAIEVYSKTNKYPSRERRIRLLAKQERHEEAVELCHKIFEDSLEPREKIFATDFLNKNGRAYRQKTIKLNNADMIHIPRFYEGRVEAGAMKYFSENGFNSFFAENYLWRSLFGLFFWDIIYDQDSGTIHNPLQRFPSDFYSPSFLKKRQSQIKELICNTKSRKQLKKKIHATWQNKNGKVNPLFGWDEIQLRMINQLIKYLNPDQLYQVLEEMCINLKSNCTGFPDLFIYNTNEYYFVEIKSPNDHLSDQQLFWIDFFNSHKINAKLIKVNWI